MTTLTGRHRHPLEPLFNPRSIAVVGASTALDKPGGRRWRTLVEGAFRGSLYPVHPTAAEVLGRRAYRSIREVPEAIDLAVIIVRAETIRAVAQDCADLRIPAVIVITGGFAEAGPEGKRLEEEVVGIIRRGGGRVMGPNCAGVFSAAAGVNCLGWTVPAGPVGVISQSGNMTLTFMQLARQKGLGFSRMVTVGNAADLGVADYVDYLEQDPETRVILVYLEGFRAGEGRQLYDVIRRDPGRKPVIFLKPGQTEGGRRAALSHTGSLAGEDRIVAAALGQAGALRVLESEEAWDAAVALAQLPPMQGDRIIVVSDGGGHATIVCDAACRAGLTVPALSAATVEALARHLPSRSGLGNPVDFAGAAEVNPEVIVPVIDVCLGDPDIAGVVFAGHFGGYFRIATEALGRREEAVAGVLADAVARHPKPFLLHTIYAREPLPTLEPLRRAGIPLVDGLESAAKAMGIAAEWGRLTRRAARSPERRAMPDGRRLAAVLDRAAGAGRLLLEPDARELASLYGLPVPPCRVTVAGEESGAVAEEFGGAVAMKLVADEIVHKSDVGGVLLDVRGREAAVDGHRQLLARAAAAGAPKARVLITPMLTGGLEVIVGALRDEQFGPVVMVGLGGVHVEALGDVAFGLAPLGRVEARDMIDRLQGRMLLAAHRGRPALDVDALADILVRVGQLMVDCPAVREVDLNPVFLFPRGAAVADARVILAEVEGPAGAIAPSGRC